MSTLAIKFEYSEAIDVSVTDDTLSVELSDGRSILVPLDWFPRLVHGLSKERNNWRLIGRGNGIHWPELDEDISVDNLLAGQSSTESQKSFNRWLSQRQNTLSKP
jgi:hypothetical protein